MLEGVAGYMPLQLCTLSAYGEPSGDKECSGDTAATDIPMEKVLETENL